MRDLGASYGLNALIFRYFNVAVADPEAEIGDAWAWHQRGGFSAKPPGQGLAGFSVSSLALRTANPVASRSPAIACVSASA